MQVFTGKAINENEAHLSSERHLFKWTGILALLTALSFVAAVAGGVGPCGGAGIPFLLAFFPLAAATGVSLLVSCVRLLARHRAAQEA